MKDHKDSIKRQTPECICENIKSNIDLYMVPVVSAAVGNLEQILRERLRTLAEAGPKDWSNHRRQKEVFRYFLSVLSQPSPGWFQSQPSLSLSLSGYLRL